MPFCNEELQLYNRSDVANVAVQYFLCSAAGDDEFDTLNSNQSTTFSIPIFFGPRSLTLSVTIFLLKFEQDVELGDFEASC